MGSRLSQAHCFESQGLERSKTRKHSLVLAIGKSVLFLLALLVVISIIHEGAHLAAALIMGVPIVSFTWFDPEYLAASLVRGATESRLSLTVVGCSGGFVAGALLLAIVALKRGWFRVSFYRWLVGLWMFALGTSQISLGVLEGMAADAYVAGATDLLSWTHGVTLAGGLAGAAVYWVCMPEGLSQESVGADDYM